MAMASSGRMEGSIRFIVGSMSGIEARFQKAWNLIIFAVFAIV